MNPRIERLKEERARVADMVAKWTLRIKKIDAKITELENTEISGIVREYGLTPDRLAALLCRMKRYPAARPEDITETGEERMNYEDR